MLVMSLSMKSDWQVVCSSNLVAAYTHEKPASGYLLCLAGAGMNRGKEVRPGRQKIDRHLEHDLE